MKYLEIDFHRIHDLYDFEVNGTELPQVFSSRMDFATLDGERRAAMRFLLEEVEVWVVWRK